MPYDARMRCDICKEECSPMKAMAHPVVLAPPVRDAATVFHRAPAASSAPTDMVTTCGHWWCEKMARQLRERWRKNEAPDGQG